MTARAAFFAPLLLMCGSTVVQVAPNAAETAALIDKRLAAAWQKAGVKPATVADDATFLRRVSLDLMGRIPNVAEMRRFLDDKSPDKRAALIANMLESPAYATHFATKWRRAWLPQADTRQFARLADDFEDWLVIRFRDNTPYDKIIHELLTYPVAALPRRGAPPVRRSGPSPTSFFAASEMKPENLAANTARAFLGINLDCAQCHNHPFARWTRDQFWQTAAFFTKPAAASETQPVRLEVAIPETKKTVTAKVLSDATLDWPKSMENDTGRKMLAGWLTGQQNPWFAKNMVNRLWAHFYGIGLAEPLDDLTGDNPPSHPELLEDLAKAFIDSGYDIKFMARAIVLSKSYQLSSAADDTSLSEDPRQFARMGVRGLTGEQLYDSLRLAAGLPAEGSNPTDASEIVMLQGVLRGRKGFAARFLIDRPATAQRSIVQALSLMNGKLTIELSTPDKNPTLLATANAPFLDTKGKVETLFLAALGRKPTDGELTALVKHVDSGGADKDPRKALADVFWALLNCSEFSTNH